MHKKPQCMHSVFERTERIKDSMRKKIAPFLRRGRGKSTIMQLSSNLMQNILWKDKGGAILMHNSESCENKARALFFFP